MIKILIVLILSLVTSSSWACLLIRGEIKVNQDQLAVHQKFSIDQTYPYRTENFLVHIKLLSKKIDGKQVAVFTIRHPKTFKILGELRTSLEDNKEVKSSMTSAGPEGSFHLESDLTLKTI